MTSPPYEKLNGCDIHPINFVTYCVMRIGTPAYLVRLDADQVEFLAKVLDNGAGVNAGTFGPSGTYYYSEYTCQGCTDKRVAIENVGQLQGFHDPYDAGLPDHTEHDILMDGIENDPADLVSVLFDPEHSGTEKEYLLGVDKNANVVLIRASGGKPKKWVLKPRGQQRIEGLWGSGWNFKGKVFFAHNKGAGVYEILLDEIDLDRKQFKAKRLGKSDPTKSNDGMSCMVNVGPDDWQ